MDSKEFRGDAGEVVRGFLSAGTCLTAIPVGGATILLALMTAFLLEQMQAPTALAVPACLVLLAPVTGLFALSARAGQFRAGFLESLGGHGGQGAMAFGLRYGLLQAAWSVPLMLIAQQALPWLAGSAMGGAGTRLTLAVWAGVALLAAGLVLPSLCLLVATRTETVSEAFSSDAWRWLLRHRREDIAPFLASALGGMMLFLLAALPPLAIVLPLAADMSPKLAAMLLVALPALPWVTAPILLGRLAGAFVCAEPIGEAPGPAHAPEAGAGPRPPRGPATFDAPVPQGSRTMAALAGIPGASPSIRMDCPTSVQPIRAGAGQAVPLGVALARAHQMADTDMEGALAELESLRQEHPRNPAVVGELARALRKAGRHEEAVQSAAAAIRLALSGGAGPIAHDVFRAFAQDAAQLHLEPSIYEQLARILCARREYEGAAWCYRAAAALGGDPRSLQKGMLGVGETASQGGQHEHAAAAYEAFLLTWPDSPLARFAKDGADEARRRAQALTSAG